jgi:hypothetical protein
MASGGYAGYGKYTLGESGKEFILNNQTTRHLESMFGPLSQDKFFRMSQGGFGGSGMAISVNQQNWSFAGSMTTEEREQLKTMARAGAYEAIADVMEQVQ